MCNTSDATSRSVRDHDENVTVVASLVVVLLMLCFLCFVDWYWRRYQGQLEKKSNVTTQSHSFAVDLVRHFLPSFAVEKYQFRGMTTRAATVDIAFDNLGLELSSGTRILQSVTGNFRAGRMCAIMGPSGAGKTTFLNVLCGKATYGKMCGSILINGERGQVSDIKSAVGFVPQDDIVHEDLTVREQIQFSAELRNPVGTCKRRIGRIVDDALHVMQIDHVQNRIVGGIEERGISGGQRKRVNIGLELVAQPSILFLDEPTSGLDASSSLTVCLSLKKMCQLGMTSIMVVHQPRYALFTLFDDVLLLGKGGQTVYLGPSVGAKAYFTERGFVPYSDENPADWFIDIIAGEVENSLVKNFKPEMLFNMWERHAVHDDTCPMGRRTSDHDDSAILTQKLEDEWDMIDRRHEGAIEEKELKELLHRCSGVMPEDVVVQEIFTRMAGLDAIRVTKLEFVEYLSSLRGAVASDKALIASDSFSALAMSPSGPSTSALFRNLEAGSVHSAACKHGLQRVIPGFGLQLRILLRRRIVQWWRMNRQRKLFVLALAAGGVILAVLDSYIQEIPNWDAVTFVNAHTAMSLLLAIYSHQVFAYDRPVFWRESSSGVSVPAFFLSRTWINAFDLFLLTFMFTAAHYVVKQPMVPFVSFLYPFLLVSFVASGWGYLLSTMFPPRHGPFLAVLIIYIFCGLMGHHMNLKQFLNGGALETITSMTSITRWSVGMSFTFMVDCLKPAPTEGVEQAMLGLENFVYQRQDFGLSVWSMGTLSLIAMGIALRCFALLGLMFRNRDKQV
eukprot:TRINITY_DN25895_c0_g1_i1.p1 TRINITY_DN25895_c0_g1~~TRINITY_DN25895_c0_g1_i1.p1  ORF type:complete len:816 (+),score=109.44 TRINITY_DN25895_c0_g1_i1:83-2449(+)